MSEQLDRIEQKLTVLNAEYKEIHDALVGNEKFNQPGIISELKDTKEKAIEAHTFYIKAKKTIKVVWGAIISFLSFLFYEIFK